MSEDSMELDVPEPEYEPKKTIMEKGSSYVVLADQERQLDFPSIVNATWVEEQLSGLQWKFIKSNTKLSPQLIVSMYKDAKKGLSKRAILARHGMPPARWSQWQKLADEGVEPYYLWSQCMFYAASQVEADVLKDIRMQASGDFKAAKWLLEHINREEYGPTPKEQTVNISGDVNNTQNNVTTNTDSVNYMDDDKAKQIAQLLQTFKVVPKLEGIEDAEVIEDGSE